MRLALTALALGLTTVVTAAPALADPPRIHVQFGVVPPAPPVYVAPAQPVPQPPLYSQSYGQPYGYAQPVYGPQRYRGGGPRWQDPRFFGMRVHDQMGQISSELNDHVRQGWVQPRALGELNARRNEIENDLRSASMDGVITFDERQHILGDLNEMRSIDDRFRAQNPQPYGGGPWGNRYRGGDDWR